MSQTIKLKFRLFFDYPMIPKSLPLPPAEPRIMTAYREFDMWYLRGQFPSLSKEDVATRVWRVARDSTWTGVANCGTGSLFWDAIQMSSAFNIAFCGNAHAPYSFRSLDNLLPEKLAASMAKFDRPTKDLNVECKGIAHLIPAALRRMYNYMGVTDQFEKSTFDPYAVKMNAPMNSSSGARAGRAKVSGVTRHGVPWVQSVSGRKLENREYAYRRYMEIVRQSEKGVPVDSDLAWVVSPKSEVFNSAGKVGLKETSDHRMKLRHYNISYFTTYLVELHVLHHRQMVERGKMIRIGMPWWNGGAYALYKVMQGEDPDMRYSDGDVSNYDMSVKRVFMELYVGSSGVYYRKGQHTQMYRNLQKFVLRRLTRRMTHMYGNVWRVILGGMPSGAYATSHGDSWILGAMFFFFF